MSTTTDTARARAATLANMPDWHVVGSRMRQLRKARSLTQDQLAEALGWSRSALANVETAGNPPGLEFLIAAADYFKVPMDWLLDRKLAPGGPELPGKYVERPDQLALLTFWDGLTNAQRDLIVAALDRLADASLIRRA